MLTPEDFVDVPRPIGTVRLPQVFNPNRAEYRKEVARALTGTSLRRADRGQRAPAVGAGAHPVESDPELRQRMRAAGQTERLERELVELTSRVDGHSQSLARDFDHVLDVLDRRGYVDAAAWTLTPRGEALGQLFHESDLLVAECVLGGLFDDLDVPALGGLLSVFVYEHRSPEPAPPPWFPSAEARQRWRRIGAVSEDLAADERSLGLPEHRPPDAGFVAAAHGWIAGEGLATVVEDEELTGGDFVRTMKQLVDLARQVALVATTPETRGRARQVADRAIARRRRRRGHRRGRADAAGRVGGSVTIRRGQDWGEEVAVPPGVIEVTTDADAVAALARPGAVVRLCGGDGWTALGARTRGDRAVRLPIDLLRVEVDGGPVHRAIAHVVARRSWWRGPIIAVMNVDRLGEWDVAPKAHPNDGRADVVEVDPAMSLQARWQASRRLRSGTHVPHPQLRERKIREAAWTFERPLRLWVDGIEQGFRAFAARRRRTRRRDGAHLTPRRAPNRP